MARYVYTGPEEERGSVPGHAFPEGVLAPYVVADLIDRGHLRDLDAPAPEPEPESAREEQPQKLTETAARPAQRPRTRPAAPARPSKPATRKK